MRFCVAVLCGLLLCASGAALSSAASLRDFINFSDPSLPGRLYVPPQAATGPRPLIVFLHGAGESGTDNTAQVNGNIDNLLTAAKARGAYLYAPQTAIGWNSSTAIDRVMAMVNRASAEQNVDELRFYATGLSMGGGGTWNLINRHGDQFAAAAPICAVQPGRGLLRRQSRRGSDVGVSREERRDGFVHNDPQRGRQHAGAPPAKHRPPIRRAPPPTFSFRAPRSTYAIPNTRAAVMAFGGRSTTRRRCTTGCSLTRSCRSRCGPTLMLVTGLGLVGDRPPVSSETTISVTKPSGIVTMPGWLNGTSDVVRRQAVDVVEGVAAEQDPARAS